MIDSKIQNAIDSIIVEGVGAGTVESIQNAEQRLIGVAVVLTHMNLANAEIVEMLQSDVETMRMLSFANPVLMQKIADEVNNLVLGS